MTPFVLVAVPLVSAVVCVVLGIRRRREVRAAAVGGAALTTLLALAQWVAVSRGGAWKSTPVSVVTGGPPLSVSSWFDLTAATVAVLVCVVALLVQVYSVGYLRPSGSGRNPGRRYPSYAALVSLFTAAMLLVVVAGDLLVLFVGWEVMGLCSYFLISYDYEDRPARAAAVKAFLVTRLGDVGLLFSIFILGTAAGSFGILDVLGELPQMSSAALTAAALLLLAGVVGKSAQFPLHVWLPDAMAGPTPVSALIHAATMVAAGVYLAARMYPLLLAAPVSLMVLAVLAAITMVGAALAALAQTDLKRVLAWSTVSQLAIMLGGIAVGGRSEALFHLLSHGAFKALLFLAAGAVIFSTGTAMLADLGGLWRRMPVTTGATLLGLAALAGVPPLSGFFSKDAILHAALPADGSAQPRWVGYLLTVAILVTVAITAAYATRVALLLFAGSARTERTETAKEVPGLLRWPLVVLMVPTALLGLAGLSGSLLPSWLDGRQVAGVAAEGFASSGWTPSGWTWWASLLAVALGVLAVYVAWLRAGAGKMRAPADLDDRDPARLLAGLRRRAAGGFGMDDLVDAAVVHPTWAGARLVRALDDNVVDAYVRGAGRGSRMLSAALAWAHTGNMQTYLTVLLAGAIALAAWVAS